jgi:hypothetical protein
LRGELNGGAGLTEIAVQTDWLRRDVERLHGAKITGRADVESVACSPIRL